MKKGAHDALWTNSSTSATGSGTVRTDPSAFTVANEPAQTSQTQNVSVSKAESGTGFSEYVKNSDPNAFDDSGTVKPRYTAEVPSAGTQLAVNIINERGADVADSIIESDYVVDNQAVAATALKNSSFAESMGYEDISQSISAMDETGTIPDQNGAITDVTVGKGVTEFTYEAPAQVQSAGGQADGSRPSAERVTIRTAKAFESLPTQEQSLYKANTTASGETFYTRRVKTDPDHCSVAPEHRKSSGNGSSGSGKSSPNNSSGSGRNQPKDSGKGRPKDGKGRK